MARQAAAEGCGQRSGAAMVNRPIVMWRIAPGRRDTPARTADAGK